MNIQKCSPLIEQAMQGDKQAYSELCELIIHDVLYICIKITGDLHHGEDAAQEALLQFASSIRKLRDAQAFPLWLNRCISNSCRNYMKKERRHIYHLSDGTLDELMEKNAEFLPEQWAEQEDTRSMVVTALQKLPARQQHILLMYYFQDMSTKDIAKVNNISESAVRSNLQYARINLKKQIEKAAGKQLTTMPAVAAVPTITLILRRDAARLVNEESTKKVLVAVGTALAGGAATVAGVQIATLVASVAPAAVAIVIAAAVPLVSSPSPSHPPEDVIGITPQYSNSVQMQEEGEGDLYISEQEEQIPQSRHNSSEIVTSGAVPEAASPATPSNPAPYTVSGLVQLADGQGGVIEHQDLNLHGICVQAYCGDSLAAEGYTDARGSYTLTLPDPNMAYELRIADNARPALGRQDATAVLEPDMNTAPVLYIADCEAPRVVFFFFDEERQPQATIDPATIELVVYDATPCEVQWEITPLGEAASAYFGLESQIDVVGLGLAPGRYTLTVTVTDLCGNESIIQKQFSIR